MKVSIGNYRKNGAERKISVKIDRWDTWNADVTLALIAVPLLTEFKKELQSAPKVDDEDVPEDLKSTSAPPKEDEWSTDDNWFKRWDWVLDEMIYAMQEISQGRPGEEQFYDHSEVDKSVAFMQQIRQIKVDRENLKVYHDRIQNGCRLFGKYFQTLWS